MAARKTVPPASRAPDAYLELVRRCPLRPIRSDEELNRATAMMDSLLDRPRLGQAEEDYLDVLSDLVRRYEDEAHAVATVDLTEAEMIEHLIEARNVSRAEVAHATRIAESTLAEVLRGKRKLSESHRSKLARYFHVSPGVFQQASAEDATTPPVSRSRWPRRAGGSQSRVETS